MKTIMESRNASLLDALDVALDKGVVISGDVTLSVADVDLVFLGLKVLLASVETADRMHMGYTAVNTPKYKKQDFGFKPHGYSDAPPNAVIHSSAGEINAVLPGIDARPDKVEKGLARLVLTIVELIRRLIEKQAARRIEGNSLSEEEVERLGETLMRLEDKMKELKIVFGLKDKDLNLNLGPLGDLI